MTWIDINFEDIHSYQWNEVEMFALCEIFKTGEGKVAQIYPYNLLHSDIQSASDLKEYDRRCDGKRYFCEGFHDNGFTPKNTIGTCRGWSKDYFDEIVEAILDCKRD